ncbi:MAG: hypothetical protein OER91_11230, partial [Gammaproteobacteria bacterium]|nr:hypothetical protein [Gammaproteobacteria bacterium]
MNNITKKIAVTAVIGAAALVLHTSNGPEALYGDVRVASIEVAAVAGTPNLVAVATADSIAVDRVGPEQELTTIDLADGTTYLSAAGPVPANAKGAAPAAQNAREADEPETREQRAAHSKMSGPV